MKGKRYPGKLRADGQVKGIHLVRICGWIDDNRFPPYQSRYRTRSKRWVAGTRHAKKFMRRFR